MPRKKDPADAEFSVIIIQLKQIQCFREETWKNNNKGKQLPKKYLLAREKTDRCLNRVKICEGKVFPKRIPKALYTFGDSFDSILQNANYIVRLLDFEVTHSESEGTSSDERSSKFREAGPIMYAKWNNRKSRKSVPSADFPSGSSSAVEEIGVPVIGSSEPTSLIYNNEKSVAGPSSSTTLRDQDVWSVAGPSCSTDHSLPSASGETSSHKVSSNKIIDSSHSSEDDPIKHLNTYGSALWYLKKGKLPSKASGKNECKESDSLSSSSESERAYNKDPEFEERLKQLNIDTWPYFQRKKKNYDPDESDAILLHETVYSSDSESTDEGSSRYQHKLIKSRMRDIPKTGSERIGNEMRNTVYRSIYPERGDNDFKVYPDKDPRPEEKPVFDDKGKAMIDLENACDFQHFVVLDFPNIPSREENNQEFNKKYKKWSLEYDRKCEEAIRKKLSAKKRAQKAYSSDEYSEGNQQEPALNNMYKYSKLTKLAVKSKPKDKKLDGSNTKPCSSKQKPALTTKSKYSKLVQTTMKGKSKESYSSDECPAWKQQ